MHKIKEVVDNQEKFKNEIKTFFKREYLDSKKKLKDIQTEDEFINNKKDELLEKFKKFNIDKGISKLFFMHPKRNREFYVWWDEKNEEAIILNYEKK